MTPRLVKGPCSARAAHSAIADPGVPGIPFGRPIPTRIAGRAYPSRTMRAMPRPSVTIHRRVQWFDTDSSTKEHNSAPLRWMEEAEAELLDRLGIVKQVYGRLPRAHVSLDYRTPVRFWDEVDITVRVDEVGRTSVTYTFEMRRGRDVAA